MKMFVIVCSNQRALSVSEVTVLEPAGINLVAAFVPLGVEICCFSSQFPLSLYQSSLHERLSYLHIVLYLCRLRPQLESHEVSIEVQLILDECLVVDEYEQSHDDLTIHSIGDTAVTRNRLTEVLNVECALEAGSKEAAEWSQDGSEKGEGNTVILNGGDQDIRPIRTSLNKGGTGEKETNRK